MANSEVLLKSLFVLLIGAGLTAGVAALQMDGTSSINLGGDSEPRCILEAEVGVGSAELSTDKIKIKESSFRHDVRKDPVFSSLSIIGPQSEMSLLKTENVEMDYTLNGPVQRTDTDDLGSVGAVSASKQSSFKAGNLPEGSYVLHMNLNWNSGQDYMRRDINVECGGENQ